jgi:NADH dehydrogenase (ubiquinone) Fe-S protein 2
MFLEISRIFNHLLALTTHGIDVGAFTPFLWAFEEREKLIELYEACFGARYHTRYLVSTGA